MEKEELKYHLAFNAINGIGARTFIKLANYFPSMESAWRASLGDFIKAGLMEKISQRICDERNKINPDGEIELLKKYNLKVCVINDKNYPSLLNQIADPPYIFYYKGEILPNDELAIAIVGSRKFSNYGKIVCEKIIPPLINSRVTIVSGLALGIDTIAHQIAIKNRGRTIAVLAGGLDKIYPSTNYLLAREITDGRGAIMSEYHSGSPSYATNFPVRNRIIAGLSLGTLVIEAGERSGSLLTAKAALDYNREVFTVPGDITRDTSVGTNGLIRIGAKLVTNAEDILNELRIETKTKEVAAKQILPDTKEEALILKHLSDDPLHIDKLLQLTNLEISKLNSTLIMMEMKGKARNLGANQYVLNS